MLLKIKTLLRLKQRALSWALSRRRGHPFGALNSCCLAPNTSNGGGKQKQTLEPPQNIPGVQVSS